MVPEFTTRTAPNPVVTFGRALPKFSASSTGSANAEPQRVSSGPWAAEKKGRTKSRPLVQLYLHYLCCNTILRRFAYL